MVPGDLFSAFSDRCHPAHTNPYSHHRAIPTVQNIVWLSVESLRYDHTSLCPVGPDTTPNLARLADVPDAASFDRCYAHSNWTRTSIASILSGLYPASHGVFSYTDKLSPERTSVPEVLSEAGYTTYFVGKNSQIGTAVDAAERFDVHLPINRETVLRHVPFTGLVKYLLALGDHGGGLTTDMNRHKPEFLVKETILDRVTASDEPVFLFAHFNGTHNPYIPPRNRLRDIAEDLPVSAAEAVEMSETLFDKDGAKYEKLRRDTGLTDTELDVVTTLYDACVAYVDEILADVVAGLRAELSDTVFVITGDHGEFFGERGLLSHVLSTHSAGCHVPLVVAGDTALTEYSGQIQHVDVVRTVLAEQGLTRPQFQGVDLRTERRDHSVVERGADRAETNLERMAATEPGYDVDAHHRGHLVAIFTRDFKYERSENAEGLYRLPDEETDVSAAYPGVYRALRVACEDYLRTHHPEESGTAEADLDAAAKRRLENMGYLVD